MDFNRLLKEEAAYINEMLKIRLGALNVDAKLMEAMEYAVLSSGKRIRPILLRQTYFMLKQNDSLKKEAFELCTAALELVHCYSLVHDDLPAMDNSDLRRGLPTVHKKYSEGMAVLVGDALLNSAMEFVLEAGMLEPENIGINKAGFSLFRKSGVRGMIRGQFIDLDIEKQQNEENLLLLTDLKTCALMEASMLMGAYLANFDENKIILIEKLAKSIGMIFQIQDDILDYKEDLKENKLSFATYFGLEKSEEYKNKYKEEAMVLLDNIGGETRFFVDLLYFLCNRKM